MMNIVKDWDLNAICKDKFDWMAPDKKKSLMTAC